MTLLSATAAHRMTARDLPAGLGPAVDDWAEDLDHTIRSGKGVRSALFEATYDACGGDDPAVRVRTGEALELLHEAFLVHDDLVDGDDHRRGHLNLQGRTRARVVARGAQSGAAGHVATAGGLLGGDLLLVAAMGQFARLPLPAPLLDAALTEVERAVVASIAGEYADVHGAAVPETTGCDRALAIGAAKTAAYTVTLPLVLGALLAGAEGSTIGALREVGRRLGTAYQVVDDVLGVFGDPAVTGKSNEGDLLRRAPTILLSFAATTEAWPRIDAALDPTSPDPDVARELLRDCGADEYALGVAADLVARARDALDRPEVPDTVRAALDPHLENALERTR